MEKKKKEVVKQEVKVDKLPVAQPTPKKEE
jgi:hypothetical protein